MGNLSPTGDIEAISGVVAGGGSNITDPLGTGAISNVAGQTERDIYQFFSETRRDVAEYALTSGRQAGQVAEDIIGVSKDFGRGGLMTINNVTGNMMYSGRFVAKNVVGLIDNQLDNVHDIIDSARSDLSSSIQMFALLTGTGMLITFIMFGSEIMKKGISLGEINLF